MVPVPKIRPARGRGGGLVDRAADLGPCDPSLIPLGDKQENKLKRGRGWPILKKTIRPAKVNRVSLMFLA